MAHDATQESFGYATATLAGVSLPMRFHAFEPNVNQATAHAGNRVASLESRCGSSECARDPLASPQAAASSHRISLGPRTNQKVLSLRTVAGREEKSRTALWAEAPGFSLHAAVRVAPSRQGCLISRATRPAGLRSVQHAPAGHDELGVAHDALALDLFAFE